jgi:hypothetical protein
MLMLIGLSATIAESASSAPLISRGLFALITAGMNR